MKIKSNSILSSVSNALSVLEIFDKDNPELGVTEIAKILGIHKSIAFRLVKTLEVHNWLNQTEQRKYCLSLKAFEVGSQVITRLGLGVGIQPILEELAGKTGESVNVGVMDGTDIMYVNKITPKKILRVEVQIGVRMPAHCTAMGKIILANLPVAQRKAYISTLKTLPVPTSRTIKDPEKLNRDLSKVKEQGFAWSTGELFPEICCVAAPIRDTTGNIVAALSIAMQKRNFKRNKSKFLEKEVANSASLISRMLGWLP